MALIGYAEAIERILSSLEPLALERVALDGCLGRILGQDLVSDRDHPTFANSAMDGFAVRSADVGEAADLEIIEELPAGVVPTHSVGVGQASQIMTGAMMPEGADAVVMVEKTEEIDGRVRVQGPVHSGENVRPAGEHLREGQVVLSSGRQLRPADLALAAYLGVPALVCARRPRVAVLATGSELIEPGQPLGPGQIYNSNGPGLTASLRQLGAEVVSLGVAPDDPASIRALLEDSLEEVDVVVTSAGVSMGKHDYVLRVLQEMGGQLDFWKLKMRPGKPLGFGKVRGRPFFALPGNPVSSMVGVQVFLKPALRKLAGLSPEPSTLAVTLEQEVSKRDGFTYFMRCTLRFEQGVWYARLTGGQGSHLLHSMVLADALLEVPESGSRFQPGTTLMARPLRPLLYDH